MKRTPTEHEIQKQILDWLKIKGIFHWRNNTGAMASTYKGKTRFMRFGAVGSPDIFAVHRGKIYGIEVKGLKGEMSAAQDEFMRRIVIAGGFYIEARSLDDVVNFPIL